jgi:hypothetical protein
MLDNKGYRHIYSEYVILIAFPRQQWLCDVMLRYTYIASLVRTDCCTYVLVTSGKGDVCAEEGYEDREKR